MTVRQVAPVVFVIALLFVVACGGEPTMEELREREAELERYEAEIADKLRSCPPDERMLTFYNRLEALEAKYFSNSYYTDNKSLANYFNEKRHILKDLDGHASGC